MNVFLPSMTRMIRHKSSTIKMAAAFSPSSPDTPLRKTMSNAKEARMMMASKI